MTVNQKGTRQSSQALSPQYQTQWTATSQPMTSPQQPANGRLVVYLVSRLAIVISPEQPSKQNIYQSHVSKLSSICCHTLLRIVATAEATSNPQIHVWDPLTLQQICRLNTHHRLGVCLLKMSPATPHVFSVSVDNLNSIQITNWKTRTVEGFRNTSRRQIFSLDIDPADPSHFVTGSRGFVNFWRFDGHSIVEISRVDLTLAIGDNFITTLTCFNYKLGQETKCDVAFTSSTGAAGVLSNRKCVKVSLVAEEVVISVCKWLEINGKLFGVLGGTDRRIRIIGHAIGSHSSDRDSGVE